MSFSGFGEILYNKQVGKSLFMMRILAPELARKSKPGQFVHVRCSAFMDPLLRRPISLHGIDYDKGTVSLLYQVVGKGTAMLSELPVGTAIDLMGPLGNGFSIPDQVDNVLVIGGGIGVAPLFPLIQSLKHYRIDQSVLLGARSSEYLLGEKELGSLGISVKIATDDGSAGIKGYVTQLAEEFMKTGKISYFYACGPTPMLKTLVNIAEKYGIDGQVSLEEYMACGVGACLACVCKTKKKDGAGDKEFIYQKACTEGPVFKASEVIFDD